MSHRAGRLMLGVTSLAGAAALASCTASGSAQVSGSTVAKSTIEQVAAQQIGDRLGGGTYTVSCPHDLAAQTGASMTCVTTFPDGARFAGTAKVTSVSNGKAHWTYQASSELTK